MTKLEKLLEELCPDGVEYKKIGDFVDYEQPSRYIVNNTNYDDRFNTPVLTAGQTFVLGYTAETEGVYDSSKFNPVIIFDDFTSAFKWVDFPFKVKSSALKILNCNEKVLLRYIYYVMEKINFKSDEHKRLWISFYSNIEIPVPPLPVQEEIVRILDNFTELTAELTAELEARKKQYEYYKVLLLELENINLDLKHLSDVADIFDSLHQTPIYSEAGFSMIRVQDVKNGYINTSNTLKVDESVYFDFIEKYKPKFEDIVVSRVGSYGNFALIPNDFCCLGQNVAIIHPNINKKYLYYILTSSKTKIWIENNVKGAGQKSLSLADIKRIPVPVPPLPEQERIVSILDRFDALCNDLTSGLPAEIEARKKQYEYYRDKLLTFKEKV